MGSAVARAQIEPGEPLLVSLDYFLHPQGAESISFSALRLEGSRAANVRAFAGDRELSFRSDSAADGRNEARLEGRVDLPEELRRRERLKLSLRYEVLPGPPQIIEPGAPLVLPMLVAAWPPEETGPTTFVATVRLPRDLRVLDSFPSEHERLDSPDVSRTSEAYRFSLPVVPALVRLRAGDAEASWLTMARALDFGAALTLVALTLYGWRRVREHLK